MTYKLLFVDDEVPNLRLLERIFRQDYYCLTASSGDDAIKLLEQHDVATIITDQRMPQMSGIDLLKRTAELRPHMVRILLTGYTDMEALVEAINCGLVYMYVTKPWNNDDLKLRVARAVEHYGNNRRRHELEIANARLNDRISAMSVGFVRSFGQALRLRDSQSYEHSVRVSDYALKMAEGFELSGDVCTELAAAAMLHEIGLICGGADVSCAPTDDRPSLMMAEQQSDRASAMLKAVPGFGDIADTIRFQHENFDGSGLPRGLIGDQIPLGSRIIRVAAEYDKMTNGSAVNRVSHGEALQRLRAGSEAKFDPRVVDLFASLAFDEPSTAHGVHDSQSPSLLSHSVN